MKTSILALSALSQLASAHYFWDVLIVDGVESTSNQYFRANTRTQKYMPIKWINTYDDTTPDDTGMRCNVGGDTNPAPEVAEVTAGSKVGAKLAGGSTIIHPGPSFAYLQATDDATASKGDGDWFKIWETGVCDSAGDFTGDAWCNYHSASIEFEIPAGTPDGEYLLRVEHVGIHGAHNGEAEFYPGCAQIKVTGGGSGTVDAATGKIPGIYKQDDESWNFSVWGGYKEYPFAAPAAWGGDSSSGSSSNSSSTAPAATSAAAPAASSAAAAAPVAASSAAAVVAPSPVAAAGSDAAADTEASSCGSKRLTRNRRAFRG